MDSLHHNHLVSFISCWSWVIFIYSQLVVMFLRFVIDVLRISAFGLHEDLNSDLHDREDTLARQVSYVNAYLLVLPAGIVGECSLLLLLLLLLLLCACCFVVASMLTSFFPFFSPLSPLLLVSPPSPVSPLSSSSS